MNIEDLLARIEKLEYHQKLLLMISSGQTLPFYRMVVEKSLDQKEVTAFFYLCDELSKELEEQKAEGFVYFHPLYTEFKHKLHPSLDAEMVIPACLRQNLFMDLMTELKKYL
jgi:hypothetical protein